MAVIGTLVVIGSVIPLKTLSDESEALQLRNPLDVLSDTPTVQEIKEAVEFIADKMGLNKTEFYKTIECESQFKYNAVGDSGLAYGPLQFHRPTFNHFCTGSYTSTKDQIKCAAQMFKERLMRHWTCWKRYFAS